MKIYIPEIPLEGLDIDLEERAEINNFVVPVSAKLKIQKVGTEIIVKGSLISDVMLQCSRCLKDFSMRTLINVDVMYHPVEELIEEETYEIKTNELDMDFYSGEELDIMNLINEQIVLNIPMKPLCSETCKGICINCGTDLNEDICKCRTSAIDPRFESLKLFLKE